MFTLFNADAGEAQGEKLDEKLRQEKVVIFLHLLGADSNGHAFRPSSPEYRHNVQVIDDGVRRVERVIEVRNVFRMVLLVSDPLEKHAFTYVYGCMLMLYVLSWCKRTVGESRCVVQLCV